MILCVSQARLSSSRLPGKILKEIDGETILGIHINRLKKSREIDKIKIAIASDPGFERVVSVCEKHNVDYLVGSVDDVLSRFYEAAKPESPELVVRVTSDCPLIDPCYIDKMITDFKKTKLDYFSNCIPPSLPDGMDAEIFTYKILEKAYEEATDTHDREHVTPFIRRIGKIGNWSHDQDLSSFRMTVDHEEDFLVIKELIEEKGSMASLEDYLSFLKRSPKLMGLNSQFQRNEGSK